MSLINANMPVKYHHISDNEVNLYIYTTYIFNRIHDYLLQIILKGQQQLYAIEFCSERSGGGGAAERTSLLARFCEPPC